MPRSSLHTLTWSQDHHRYEWSTHGHLEQCFRPDEHEVWLRWIAEQTAFSFAGITGHLNVYRESRPRGGSYWYAYHVEAGRTAKSYLGPTSSVTFSRLEEIAHQLSGLPARSVHRETHASPSDDDLGAEVLRSKLAPPLVPASLVIRERLLTLLDQAQAHRLTVLSASAGWGKTTMLSLWATRSSLPVAWLSLDELDTTPTHFWLSVLAALRTCVPGVGETARTLLRSPQAPPLPSIVLTLLHELERLAEPTMLLIDDYHLISEQAIHDSILFLLEHLPTQLHLVLATRVDPPLALARWRVRGQLLELRDAQLRFQEEETRQFLTETMGLALSPDQVAQLSHRTEGWIAGLQLAALSLQQREDHATFLQHFTGTHRFVLDYVQEEILERLPPRLRDFLLQAAILTRLSASLCQAVTLEPDSQTLLEHLERANLFVVSLDDDRRWYRLHDLFRDVLHARLQASQPQRVPLLHQRAAYWYEAQGLLREAIPHALEAREYAFAASLMEQAAEDLWVGGEASTVQAWLATLPHALLIEHIRLALNTALYRLQSLHMVAEESYASGQAHVKQFIARLERVLQTPEGLALPVSEQALIQRRLWFLHAWLEVRGILRKGEKERLRLLAQEAETMPLDEEERWNFLPLSLLFWSTGSFQSEGALLIPSLTSAKQRATHAGDVPTTIRVMPLLVLAYKDAAQWHRVEEECQQALSLIEQIDWKTSITGYLYYCLYHAYYAWNRLKDASNALQQALRIAREWQQVDLLMIGLECVVQLSLANGDLASASQALQQIEALEGQDRFAYHASESAVNRVRVWLAQGKLAEAAQWAAQVEPSVEERGFWHLWSLLLRVHVLLAQQQYATAVKELSRFREYLDRPGDTTITIEFLALSVIALFFDGNTDEAIEVAIRLLALTQPEQAIRVYLDAGTPMQQVLQMLLSASQNRQDERLAGFEPYLSHLLHTFAHTQRELLAQATPGPEPVPSILPTPLLPLLEPLTSREQRILRLLAAGYSNQQIAQALVVSLNTVKTHLKNLYGKLQVKSRTQATALARDLRLL